MKMQELFVSPKNWTQNRPYNFERTAFCLIGAVYQCYDCFCEELKLRIKRHLKVRDLAEWNDAPERIFEDIRQLVIELDI